MKAKFAKAKRAQLFIVGALLVFVILFAMLGMELLLSRTGAGPPIQGEPKKNSVTGLYTVYLVVNGHRDHTILHMNLHANIHIDSVSYYFSNPENLPSGLSWTDFSKPIHVTVTVNSFSLSSTLASTFDVSVALGARWSQVLIYTLPSGNYTIEAQGIDQDGFKSSSTTTLVLP
jgi:hypothetical protein